MDNLQISLKSARINNNMTQVQVAKLLGVSKYTIINWENEKTRIPIYAKKYLADIYNININFLK